jgi:hypothetical protein
MFQDMAGAAARAADAVPSAEVASGPAPAAAPGVRARPVI